MGKNKIVYRVIVPTLILSIAVLYIHFFHLDNGTRVTPIAAENISSMTVTVMPEEETIPCDREQIESFAKAYNHARNYRDDYGTTPMAMAKIVFNNGDTLRVWGGGCDFQGMERDGERHNIRGRALGAWFDGIAAE